MTSARLRPLIARPGARFACAGDGLCCSDIHLVAPLRSREIVALRRRAPGAVARSERSGAEAMVMRADGTCPFLEEGRCALHVDTTAPKPVTCRSFPYGLVATPAGGRITTLHRCPCRTLGERPPLDLEDAARSLGGRSGRLTPLARIGDRISITDRTSVSFATYAREEAAMIDNLVAGESPSTVLGIPAGLPDLERLTWSIIGRTFRAAEAGGTAFDAAMAWFGHALQARLGEPTGPLPARPWTRFFDAAEARATVPTRPGAVIGDWAADVLWDLSWAAGGTLAVLATDLSVRWSIATALAATWVGDGRRPDRAEAEAVMVVETIGSARPWRQALGRMTLARPRLGAQTIEACRTPV
ncbi:Hypothetical protein A7982_06021 [Minicystis rosea]|nr:Hypothetical protein A7982_06021 [Minicystis rosea]